MSSSQSGVFHMPRISPSKTEFDALKDHVDTIGANIMSEVTATTAIASGSRIVTQITVPPGKWLVIGTITWASTVTNIRGVFISLSSTALEYPGSQVCVGSTGGRPRGSVERYVVAEQSTICYLFNWSDANTTIDYARIEAVRIV